MLRDTAVDLIMKRCGNRTSDSLRQACIDEMVLVQQILEGSEFLPWFLISELTEAYCSINDERLPLPDDYLLGWEYGELWRYDEDAATGTARKRMIRDDYSIIYEKYQGVGEPSHYDIDGKYYRLRKIPDIQYKFMVIYFAKAASLEGAYGDANNIENVWLANAADWIIGETGVVIAEQHLQSKTMGQRFQQQADRGRARVFVRHTAWEEVNKYREMGDS